MTAKTQLFFAANIALPLSVGGLFYLALCPETYLAGLVGLRLPALAAAPRLLRWYLCDVLWAYALCFALCAVLRDAAAALKLALAAQACIECAQLLWFVPGTFDVFDLFVQTMACIAAFGIIKLYRRNQHEKSEETSGACGGATGLCADGAGQRLRQ